MKKVPLASVARILQGGRHGLSGLNFTNTGYPAYGAGGLNGYLPSWEYDEAGIVLSSIGARCGKCFLVSGKWISLANTQVILPIPKKADTNFLFYQLNDEQSWRRSGTAQPFIKPSDVKNREVYLPPTLDEQRRIAAILQKADYIRQNRLESILMTNELIRSNFFEMFGDPGTNPKKWDRVPISELLIDRPNAIRTGPFGSQLRHSEFITEGVPVLAIDNIVTNEFKWTEPRCLPRSKYEAFKRYRVFPRDVIVTIMGTTGRAAVAPDDLPECMSTKHLCVMTLNQDKVDSFFIWATLIFDQTVKQQASLAGGGAIMEGWNMSIISNLHVRVPPLPEQNKFSNVLSKLKENQELQKKSLDSSEVLFNSLIYQAFRGELQ
jgi:type I restriction enzyme S subunit